MLVKWQKRTTFIGCYMLTQPRNEWRKWKVTIDII